MNAAFVIVFPRGQLTELDKARLEESGVIAVEADDPKAVRQLHLTTPLVSTELSGDAVVHAALSAMAVHPPELSSGIITSAGRVAHSFVSLLAASLKEPTNDNN